MAKIVKTSKEQDSEISRRLTVNNDGLLVWKVNFYKAKEGNIACSLCTNGYRSLSITVDGRRLRLTAHRVVWFLSKGYWPLTELDHKDENRSNNRITNLREATRSQNMARVTRTKLSGLPRGVSDASHTNKTNPFVAQLANKFLGYFRTAELASAAYEKAYTELYGKNWR